MPLKTQWTQICQDFYQKNPGRIVTKFNFMRLFSRVWCRAVTPANIIAGFRRAGVYPLNPNVISVTEADSDTSNEASARPSSSLADSCEVSGSGGDAPSNGLSDVAGTSTNLTDTADSANSANTSAASVSFPNTCSGSSGTIDLLSHTCTSTTTTSILSSTTSLAQPTFTNEQVERFQHCYEEGFDLYDLDYYQWLIKVHHPDSIPTEIQTNTHKSISPSNPAASDICSSSSSWIYKRFPGSESGGENSQGRRESS